VKVDRQTIVAVVTALQEWLETDHEARIAGYEKRLEAMASELDGAPGVSLSIVHDEGASPRLLRLALDPEHARTDATGLAEALLSGSPAIAVGRDADAITINPVTLREADDGRVVSRLGELLL
jgi:seryl-tRNA(Sec) selenium transferase